MFNMLACLTLVSLLFSATSIPMFNFVKFFLHQLHKYCINHLLSVQVYPVIKVVADGLKRWKFNFKFHNPLGGQLKATAIFNFFKKI